MLLILDSDAGNSAITEGTKSNEYVLGSNCSIMRRILQREHLNLLLHGIL